MTANGKAEPSPGPHPYFMAIEEVFIDLRGSPLQLSPKDWQVARGWHDKAVPLELVERTVREIFARRKAKGNEDKVWSLRHCKRAVDAAWKRQQELVAPGVGDVDDELDLAGRLAKLAAALPVDLVGRQQLCQQIESLEGGAESIEEALAAIDLEVVESARRHLDQAQREDIDREVAVSRAALAQRLPAAELARSAARLGEEILRRRLELPVLSLFAPEASEPPA